MLPVVTQINITHLPNAPQPFVLDAIVYQADLCKWLKRSPVTLWRWIKSGYLPQPAKLGQYHVWPAAEIAEWAKGHGLLLTSGVRHTCK